MQVLALFKERFYVLVLFLILFSQACRATQEIRVEYIGNYDGDTIRVNLPDLKRMDSEGVYSVFWDEISVRLGGIDTPEIKGKCENEKKLAKRAKTFVSDMLSHAREITIGNVGRDKYFRILGEIYADGLPLAQLLIDEGLAVPYNGGTKRNIWCEAPQGSNNS